MKLPLVTVVVSTYNRPSILRSALKSVMYQTFEQWQVFVIGDNCSEETAQMIQELNHPKIKYHNNPLRYGEQSGSNNIGMALSTTKYVALLNHDDVWTPDYLEKAMEHLDTTKTEFYIANSIFSKRVDENGFPILKHAFTQRRAIKVFSRSHIYVEPSSSWVFERQLIDRIGFWKHKSEMYRTPIVNYMLRCWKLGVNMHFAQEITCIASAFHHTASTPNAYAYKGREVEKLVAHFDLKKQSEEPYIPALESLSLIKESPFFSLKDIYVPKKLIIKLLKNDFTALLYYFSGLDVWETFLSLRSLRSSRRQMQLSESRTGESKQIVKPQFSEVIELAKKNLA
jgi:glycosyltransferase involved in cell wall biosynthesis